MKIALIKNLRFVCAFYFTVGCKTGCIMSILLVLRAGRVQCNFTTFEVKCYTLLCSKIHFRKVCEIIFKQRFVYFIWIELIVHKINKLDVLRKNFYLVYNLRVLRILNFICSAIFSFLCYDAMNMFIILNFTVSISRMQYAWNNSPVSVSIILSTTQPNNCQLPHSEAPFGRYLHTFCIIY